MEKLKDALKKRGIKQNWLAEKIGVSKVTVNLWCTSKRRISDIHRIAIEKLIQAKIDNNDASLG